MSQNKYYFTHVTESYKTLVAILKTGKIQPSIMLDKKFSRFSGDYKHNNIFMNIYFDDIKNLDYMWSWTILLSPDIVKKNKMEFHGGWGYIGGPFIEMKDEEAFQQNLRKIKAFVKNPKLPKQLLGLKQMEHEFLCKKPISIKKHCLGIFCPDKDKINKLQKLIEENGYNIKIYEKKYPLPTFRELSK